MSANNHDDLEIENDGSGSGAMEFNTDGSGASFQPNPKGDGKKISFYAESEVQAWYDTLPRYKGSEILNGILKREIARQRAEAAHAAVQTASKHTHLDQFPRLAPLPPMNTAQAAQLSVTAIFPLLELVIALAKDPGLAPETRCQFNASMSKLQIALAKSLPDQPLVKEQK